MNRPRLLPLSLLLLTVVAFRAGAAAPAARPVPAITRALIVSIDGLRPDVLLRANGPHIRTLMATGSFTLWAQTTNLAITLPSHVSMLTGVTPRRHEIEWNRDLPLSQPVYPRFPTLFELAKKSGYTTAMVAGKSKFDTLAKPGTLDWSYVPQNPKTDTPDVASHAVQLLRDHQPQVLFVHLPGVDNVGHAIGWGTPQQLAAVEDADRAVGQILTVLDELKLSGSTLVILSADHGGAGRSHGPEDPRSRFIPWIAHGPGVAKNLDLTTYAKLTINTEDTFATTCAFLGIPLASGLDGKPVLEILERNELLQPKKAKPE